MDDDEARLSADNLLSGFELYGKAAEALRDGLTHYKNFAEIYVQANLTRACSH